MGICMSTNEELYGLRASGIAQGDVFTRPEVVEFMLDQANYVSTRGLSNVSILEPSCGTGEFIIKIIERLYDSSLKFNFDFLEALRNNVMGIDLDSNKIETCKDRLRRIYGEILEIDSIFRCEDFFKCEIEKYFDIVIGNPPYIRYENIPKEMVVKYKKQFKTFHYRCDLYVLFFEKSLSLLKEDGLHLFVCSNRWLKNEYGKKLRLLVASGFWLQQIWNLEKVSPFLENVSAYTSITKIQRTIFSTNECEYFEIEDLGIIRDVNPLTKSIIPHSSDWSNLFIPQNHQKTSSLYTLTQLGFKSGIGVATGADKVFVSKDLPNYVEESLLLRAINSKDLRGDLFLWNGAFLLNPFTSDGSLINLSEYPKAADYLYQYYDKLSQRHIAKGKPDVWYKTIDRIVPYLLSMPKVLIPDMSGNSRIFVDDGKYYPLHNLYYVTGRSLECLEALAAILMSDFINQQLLKVTTCMNGGYPRWQSQHLKKLKIPNVFNDEDAISHLRNAYWQNDLREINSLVNSYITIG